MAALILLPGDYDLEIVRGDSFDLVVTVQEGSPVADVDLTGATVEAHIKTSTKSSTIAATLECVVDPDQVTNTGQVHVIARDAQTALLSKRKYVWDLQVRHAADVTYPEGRVRTYLAGDVKVKQDVTRPVA